MKHVSLILVTALALSLGSGTEAACYADYKAKRDNPLRLHYGVMELHNGCKKKSATREARQRLKANGWVLLNVLSVFKENGLAKRQGSADRFFLRY